MKPVGALTHEEVLAVVRRHGIIYKDRRMKYSSGISKIIKVETRTITADARIVIASNANQNIILARWFIEKPPIGYLFDNYFHALAHHMNTIQSNKQ